MSHPPLNINISIIWSFWNSILIRRDTVHNHPMECPFFSKVFYLGTSYLGKNFARNFFSENFFSDIFFRKIFFRKFFFENIFFRRFFSSQIFEPRDTRRTTKSDFIGFFIGFFKFFNILEIDRIMHDYTLLANNNFNLNFEILQKPKKWLKRKI
jgi:hypothetical protein